MKNVSRSSPPRQEWNPKTTVKSKPSRSGALLRPRILINIFSPPLGPGTDNILPDARRYGRRECEKKPSRKNVNLATVYLFFLNVFNRNRSSEKLSSYFEKPAQGAREMNKFVPRMSSSVCVGGRKAFHASPHGILMGFHSKCCERERGVIADGINLWIKAFQRNTCQSIEWTFYGDDKSAFRARMKSC